MVFLHRRSAGRTALRVPPPPEDFLFLLGQHRLDFRIGTRLPDSRDDFRAEIIQDIDLRLRIRQETLPHEKMKNRVSDESQHQRVHLSHVDVFIFLLQLARQKFCKSSFSVTIILFNNIYSIIKYIFIFT